LKLLLVAYYYPPPDGAGTGRPAFMTRYLRERGHDVTVLTRSYAGDETRKGLIRVHDPSCNGRRRGMGAAVWLVRRLWVETANSLGVPRTVLSCWYRRALRAGHDFVAREAPDLVLATYPPAETLMLGMALARRSGSPLVADFRDGLTFEPVEGVLPLRFAAIRHKYAEVEQHTLAMAAGVSAAHPALADYLRGRAPQARILWLPNGYDPAENIRPLPVDREAGFHLVHTGRFGRSDPGCDPTPLVRVLERMPAGEAPCCLHLVGRLTAAEKRLFRPLVRRGRVKTHPAASRAQSLAWQAWADGLLLVVSPRRPSVIPGKLLEYLPRTAPILAVAPGGAAADMVMECGRGWAVDPRDLVKLQTALAQMVRGQEPPGRRDDARIARFAWPRLGHELESFLLEVVARHQEVS